MRAIQVTDFALVTITVASVARTVEQQVVSRFVRGAAVGAVTVGRKSPFLERDIRVGTVETQPGPQLFGI